MSTDPTAASLVVLAPVTGTVVGLEQVPDPVFAEALVGPGLAVDPVRGGEVEVLSPVAGTLVKLHPHAFVVVTEDGKGVLVHLGLDTVELRGEGFTLRAQEKDTLTAGQVVLSWSPGRVADGGRSPVCPVIALEGTAADLDPAVAPGEAVAAGQPLLVWR